jgi:hypothetical protein
MWATAFDTIFVEYNGCTLTELVQWIGESEVYKGYSPKNGKKNNKIKEGFVERFSPKKKRSKKQYENKNKGQ